MFETVHNAAKAYLQHLKEIGKKDRTLYTYAKDLQQIEDFFGKDKKLSAIQPAQVGKFFLSNILLKLPNGRNRADETVKKTKRVLRMFFVWAKEKGIIKKVPLPKGEPMGRSLVTDG